jgi:hypothetical protein
MLTSISPHVNSAAASPTSSSVNLLLALVKLEAFVVDVFDEFDEFDTVLVC